MRSWNIVIEQDVQTGSYIGYVPGWPGANSQRETVGELKENLAEVISMFLEDGEPSLESEFVGTETVQVG
jgi:predicted RNase H-like HicB family nuclease